jgi:hypothetical protein
MNQRIKELAEQARTSVPAGLDVGQWIEKYNQILGELIIRECISAVEDTNDRYRRDYFADKIKQHFSIE